MIHRSGSTSGNGPAPASRRGWTGACGDTRCTRQNRFRPLRTRMGLCYAQRCIRGPRIVESGGKAAELQGTPEAVDSVEEMLREFEMLKRSM